jgi:hypothetical protein
MKKKKNFGGWRAKGCSTGLFNDANLKQNNRANWEQKEEGETCCIYVIK